VGRPAVFLDRDGTVIVDKVHLTDPEEVELLPGAAEAVRQLNEAGLFTVIVSNQAVIARGLATPDMVNAAMHRTQELLMAEGARIDAFYYCPDHPVFSKACQCRKPAPGMLLQAAEDHDLDLDRSYMVGDWWADIGAGAAAGTRTVLLSGAVEGTAEVDEKLAEHGLEPDIRFKTILDAVLWILIDVGHIGVTPETGQGM
jgi:D-glycero-D-manno-heptose 1,7-bisphosphate phosphatase